MIKDVRSGNITFPAEPMTPALGPQLQNNLGNSLVEKQNSGILALSQVNSKPPFDI
jgi:hypothetical protein